MRISQRHSPANQVTHAHLREGAVGLPDVALNAPLAYAPLIQLQSILGSCRAGDGSASHTSLLKKQIAN